MSGIEHLLSEASPWLERYGYAALAVSVMLEGMGIPTPGGILMSGAALLAARGELSVAGVWLTSVTAALVGDNLGYWIGRSGGRRLLLRAGVNRRRLRRFQRFFQRFGVWLIVLGRFFDGTRQLNGLVAGSAGMPWPRFLAADCAGSIAWVSIWVFGIVSFEHHAATLHRLVMAVNPWVAAGVLAALAITGFLLFRRGEPDGTSH